MSGIDYRLGWIFVFSRVILQTALFGAGNLIAAVGDD